MSDLPRGIKTKGRFNSAIRYDVRDHRAINIRPQIAQVESRIIIKTPDPISVDAILAGNNL